MEDRAADAWLDDCQRRLPEGTCMLVGWSLGAMLALRLAARLPQQVKSLLLLAATPRFVQTADWPHAIEADAFSAFEQGVLHQPEKTLRRFSAMMFHGDQGIPRYQPVEATNSGLQSGLSLLQNWDLRDEVAAIRCPVDLLHGTEDAVIPCSASQALATMIPQARLHIIKGSHALPLCHADAVRQVLAAQASGITSQAHETAFLART